MSGGDGGRLADPRPSVPPRHRLSRGGQSGPPVAAAMVTPPRHEGDRIERQGPVLAHRAFRASPQRQHEPAARDMPRQMRARGRTRRERRPRRPRRRPRSPRRPPAGSGSCGSRRRSARWRGCSADPVRCRAPGRRARTARAARHPARTLTRWGDDARNQPVPAHPPGGDEVAGHDDEIPSRSSASARSVPKTSVTIRHRRSIMPREELTDADREPLHDRVVILPAAFRCAGPLGIRRVVCRTQPREVVHCRCPPRRAAARAAAMRPRSCSPSPRSRGRSGPSPTGR